MAVIKLPQTIIDQIAAGEVVEGPHSIVKELVENSLDAEGSHITVRIKEGGNKSIIVEDDGVGISKPDLEKVCKTHTTSKIKDIEDLNSLGTFGFRGEALASISSVSSVEIISSDGQESYKIEVNEGNQSEAMVTSRAQGTTVKVTNLFEKIPARKKYLRSSRTSYRKVVSQLNKMALMYPTVRFTFYHDDRQVFDYMGVKIGEVDKKVLIHPKRVGDILKDDLEGNFIPVHLDAEVAVIGGFVGHPKLAKNSATHQYIFVNGRAIWDNGIARSIYNGVGRFIPKKKKLPFVINVNIDPSQVDVNVHPRKEEVKFLNPFRVYKSVESAVEKNLKEFIKDSNSEQEFTELKDQSFNAVNRLRESSNDYKKSYFSDNSHKGSLNRDHNSPKDSIEFTKRLLTSEDSEKTNRGDYKVHQFLSRYFVVEKGEQLWIVDQHAAAERIRFEELLNAYESKDLITKKQLLVPLKIELSEQEIAILKELEKFLDKFGFSLEFTDKGVQFLAIPEFAEQSRVRDLLDELFEESDDLKDIENFIEGKYQDIISTLACHTSLRVGQQITTQGAQDLFNKLLKCDNPYSCPHGRPIIWKLTTDEINSHFNR
jgi:DNA mismatch repair protein MutL